MSANMMIQVRWPLLIVSLLLVIGCLVSSIVGWWNYIDIRIRVTLAEDQTRFFEQMVKIASAEKPPQETEASIKAIKIYYPSGTRQRIGSHLDVIVERAREQSIQTVKRLATPE